MRTHARIHKHPVHPMIVVLPMGLWIFSFICDIAYLISKWELYRQTALVTMVGGILGGIFAGVSGFIDYMFVKDQNRRARKIGFFHMALNLAAIFLYVVNALYRGNPEHAGSNFPYFLSAATIVIISVSGWLGGEMVYVERIGVYEGPHPNPEDETEKAAA